MAINNNLDKKMFITYALIMELLLDLKKKNVIPYSQKFNFLSSKQIILNKINRKIIH